MADLSTTLSARMQQALHLSRSKAAIDTTVRALPVAERQAVLLDLLAAYELETPAKSSVVAASAAPKAAHAPEPEATPADNAAPPAAVASAPGSLSDRLMAILREQPEAPIEFLSQTLCGGTDNASRNRVSTTLSYLKRRGKVKNVGPGKWRLVEAKRATKPRAAKAAAKPKAAAPEEAPPAKQERASVPPAAAPSAAERVRALLNDHPEGLTTGQIRDLLGPSRPRDISTVVAKMAGRGLLVASGQKGAFVYRLATSANAGGSGNGNG